MRRTSRNPTRRVGPRTGAIPVSEEQVSRIIGKIFRSGGVKPVRSKSGASLVKLVGRTLARSRTVGAGKHKKRLTIRYTTNRIEVRDKIENYATGKVDPLIVEVVDGDSWAAERHPGASGWAGTEEVWEGRRVSKRDRLARITRAIEALGLRPTEKRVSKALESRVASQDRRGMRTARVTLVAHFNEPYNKKALRESMTQTLRHELAHSMDESVRRRQIARLGTQTDLDQLEQDVPSVAYALHLPRKKIRDWFWTMGLQAVEEQRGTEQERQERRRRRLKLPRRKSAATSRPISPGQPTEPQDRFGERYYNDPVEVTARIVEILHELDTSTPYSLSLREELARLPSFYPDRSQRLLVAIRFSSRTFTNIEHILTPANFARVMKAIYDRYHTESWWPQATGVYKNRRTSRRRTSRPS